MISVHRKIRAVVPADSLDEAIKKSTTGLENAMDNEILANGVLSTLTGEHTLFSPSTYFKTDKSSAGYPVVTEDGEEMLDEAIKFTIEKTNCFLYTIDRRSDSLTATPISTKRATEQLRANMTDGTGDTWIVTFDLRYDFDANPHKPYEILDDHT